MTHSYFLGLLCCLEKGGDTGKREEGRVRDYWWTGQAKPRRPV